jgi:hypothetical protein
MITLADLTSADAKYLIVGSSTTFESEINRVNYALLVAPLRPRS